MILFFIAKITKQTDENTARAERVQANVIKGEFKIKDEWDEKFLDPSTEKFRKLEGLIRAAVEKILRSDEKIDGRVDVIYIDVHFR